MNDDNDDDVEVMLQKRIEAMLAADEAPKARAKVQYDAADLYVEELLSKVGGAGPTKTTTKKTVKFSEEQKATNQVVG